MKKNKGFSLAEAVVSSAILLLVASSVMAASVMLRDVCRASIAAHELQRSASIIVGYVIQHGPGETAYNGLRSAVEYSTDGYPAGGGINFKGLDNVWRKYYVRDNTIIYESPTISSPSGRRAVYTAPPGVEIYLSFSSASEIIQAVSVTIDLSQTIRGKRVSGNIVTWVNLMNVNSVTAT